MLNDKALVIVALVILGCYTLYAMGTSGENIITAIVSGLCGIAVGTSLKKDIP